MLYLNVLTVSLTVFQQEQGALLPHYCQMEIQVQGLHQASIDIDMGYFHFCWLLTRVLLSEPPLTHPKHRGERASQAGGWEVGSLHMVFTVGATRYCPVGIHTRPGCLL